MNSVYFACLDCKNYIDAGGRWCTSNLERFGLIARNERVDVDMVLQADEYWHSEELQEEHAALLRQELPKIRRFLKKHREHHIIYAEAADFLWNDEELDWLDKDGSEFADRSPRYFAEVLGFMDWEQVVQHMENIEDSMHPLWWTESNWTPNREDARRKFEELVRKP